MHKQCKYLYNLFLLLVSSWLILFHQPVFAVLGPMPSNQATMRGCDPGGIAGINRILQFFKMLGIQKNNHWIGIGDIVFFNI